VSYLSKWNEEETRYRWTVKFPTPDMEIPHAEATCTFAFGSVRKADRVVTVDVTIKAELAVASSDQDTIYR